MVQMKNTKNMIAEVKKKRVSKKNKASWRKHTDIKDVEAFLEVQRQEERIGRVADKKDEELFIDDRKPVKALLSEKQKRKITARKKLNTYTSLENRSKVLDPIVKRNYVKQKKSGRNIIEEVLQPVKSKRITQSTTDRLKFYEKREEKLNKKFKDKYVEEDVWAVEDVLDKHPEFKNDWISRRLAEHHLRNTGKPIVKVRKTVQQKLGKIITSDLPHPGSSYNPTLKDHQDLLSKVVEKEEHIIKAEKHLKRVTTDMFNKVTEEDRDREKFVEMSANIPDENGVVVKEEDESDGEKDAKPYNTTNPPVENKKKDKKARRKQKEQKEIQKEKEKKKLQKKQITDLHRLRALKEEVLKGEEELNEAKKRRKVALKEKKSKPGRLGKVKYNEPEIAISMPEELTGDLRSLKPDHSLLLERYKSLQARNVLVPTAVKGLGKKPKRKKYIKKTHRGEVRQNK